ncbi:formyltetrahydrofolate deformylase [Alienimonas californiensis]|uniref:Formyltetrahydrofolate deformylase n=1 Tax=Alienimonas californiensis TaxID=2527989 RepID=A0A517PAX7_9PLAN|nr:formyltransferase family protein [Alienimonas californiensis]QDT16524.1 Formyltetrahydrofolate deformylase [Alienimonas californiensis]
MHAVVTAVGPDNRGLADPIIHHLTSAGANLHEIQMYDRDQEHLFAMLVRAEWENDADSAVLRADLDRIGAERGLSVRTWVPGEQAPPRLAICTTYRPEPATAVLRAVRDGRLKAEVSCVLGNRPACRGVAEEFGVPFFDIGDDRGAPDNDRLVDLLDEHAVDYVLLARYMRVLPAGVCWKYAGGRILNLHHGLLPPFPGFRPYEDAHARHMLTYGSTVHFIVPELDAGEQIVHQATFTVPPGTSLKEIKRRGETEHEPAVLVEGVRRVLDGEVALRFHRVVPVT